MQSQFQADKKQKRDETNKMKVQNVKDRSVPYTKEEILLLQKCQIVQDLLLIDHWIVLTIKYCQRESQSEIKSPELLDKNKQNLTVVFINCLKDLQSEASQYEIYQDVKVHKIWKYEEMQKQNHSLSTSNNYPQKLLIVFINTQITIFRVGVDKMIKIRVYETTFVIPYCLLPHKQNSMIVAGIDLRQKVISAQSQQSEERSLFIIKGFHLGLNGSSSENNSETSFSSLRSGSLKEVESPLRSSSKPKRLLYDDKWTLFGKEEQKSNHQHSLPLELLFHFQASNDLILIVYGKNAIIVNLQTKTKVVQVSQGQILTRFEECFCMFGVFSVIGLRAGNKMTKITIDIINGQQWGICFDFLSKSPSTVKNFQLVSKSLNKDTQLSPNQEFQKLNQNVFISQTGKLKSYNDLNHSNHDFYPLNSIECLSNQISQSSQTEKSATLQEEDLLNISNIVSTHDIMSQLSGSSSILLQEPQKLNSEMKKAEGESYKYSMAVFAEKPPIRGLYLFKF